MPNLLEGLDQKVVWGKARYWIKACAGKQNARDIVFLSSIISIVGRVWPKTIDRIFNQTQIITLWLVRSMLRGRIQSDTVPHPKQFSEGPLLDSAMVLYTKGNGKGSCGKGTGSKYGQTEPGMRGSGIITKPTEKEDSFM